MPSSERFARRLARLERELKRLGTTPQLAYSSVEDGAVGVVVNGVSTMQLGLQHDGTSTSASLTGPPPPQPALPAVFEVDNGLRVYWDGTWADPFDVAPMDFARITIHATPLSEFTTLNPLDQTRIVGSIPEATGGERLVGLPAGIEHIVHLVAWSLSGQPSLPSEPALGTPYDFGGQVEADLAAVNASIAAGDSANSTAINSAVDDYIARIAAEQSARSAADTANTNAITQAVNDFNAGLGTKITTFRQTSAPSTTGRTTGDLWYDSDDGDRLYRWSGIAWVDVRDSGIAAAANSASTALTNAQAALTAAQAAQATADGAIRTYYQSTPPWADGSSQPSSSLGDMWFDQDDGQAYRWNGTSWQTIEDSSIGVALAAAQNAQTTADGKITAFYSTGAPAVAETGDLWYDTDDKNKPYYYNGSVWVSIQDGTINDAQIAASAALTAANGKNKVTHSINAPGATANTAGDIWFQHADASLNRVITQWRGGGATSWTQVAFDRTIIPQIDIGAGTFGSLDGVRLSVGSVLAEKLTVASLGAILVANGGFEETGVWTYASSATRVTTAPLSGAYHARLTASGNPGLSSPMFPVAAGETLSLLAYAKAVSGPTAFYLRISWRNAAGAEIGISDTATALNVAGSYTRYGGATPAAPAGTTQAFVQVYNTVGTVDVDSIDCRRQIVSAMVANGAIKAINIDVNDLNATGAITVGQSQVTGLTSALAGKETAGASAALQSLWGAPGNTTKIFGGNILTRSIGADKLVISDFTNYFPDRYLNLGDDPLTYFSPNSGYHTSAPPAGGRALKFQSRDHTASRFQTAARPGDQFLVSCDYAMIAGSDPFAFQLWMQKTDGTNTTVIPPYNATYEVISDTPAGSGWTHRVTKVTIPTGATDCAFVIPWVWINQATSGGASTAVVGNMTIQRMNGGELIVDGSIMAKHATADLVEGLLVTGRVLQTSASANRGIKISNSGLIGYDSQAGSPTLGQVMTSINTTTGQLTAVGGLQTASGAGERIVIRNDGSGGVIEAFVGVSGEVASIIDPTYANSRPGLLFQSGTVAGKTEQAYVAIQSEAATFSQIESKAAWHKWLTQTGFLIATLSSGGMTVATQLSVGSVGAGQDAKIYGKIYSDGSYADTTTAVANAIFVSDHHLARSTSLGRFKLNQEPLTVDDSENLLNIVPKTWFDKSHVDSNNGSYEGLNRIPGAVAEEVEAVAPLFATYDDDGLSGVAYDRIGVALVPIIRSLRDRVTRLEAQLNEAG